MLKHDNKYLKRDSNMELLRIIAMIGILVLHADFFALGAPKMQDCINTPYISFLRILVETLFIISVNLFVLLSGWYSIKPTRKSFSRFIFQILFFNILFFVLFAFIEPHEALSWSGISSIFMIDRRFWFVKAYILLFMLAPILNSFTAMTNKRQFKIVLICFFMFQTFYGWFFKSVTWFNNGYSTISFIGLYLLAQYIHKYIPIPKIKLLITVFLIYVITNTALSFWLISINKDYYSNLLFYYNSPLVIIASVSVFLLFKRLTFSNSFINYLAISSFAVFLFHANHFFLDKVYVALIREWFTNNSLGIFIVKTTGLILLIFIISQLLDKIRIIVWNYMQMIIKHENCNINTTT